MDKCMNDRKFDVYLSNADVNKMKKDEIVEHLRELNLNTRGNKDEVSKRLKMYYKRKRAGASMTAPKPDRFYDYLCVIDFECTCEGRQNVGYPHEIIEFPVILLRTTTREVIDEFHSFCKPSINPILSPFCMELTGITQEQVDNAPPFSRVWDEFLAFLRKHGLGTTQRFAFVADGPADFGTFMQLQFQHLSLPIPHDVRYWINLRRTYCRFYKQQRTTLQKMLDELGMEFTGRQHSGLDDARNIARVAAALIESGCQLWINERLLKCDRLAAAGKAEYCVHKASTCINSQAPADTAEEDDYAFYSVGPQSKAKPIKKPAEATSQALLLPYKVIVVSKEEFLHDEYENCFSCDENDVEDVSDLEKAD